MKERRILVGSFDLFHTGHLGQIAALSGPSIELTVGILSDEGIREFWGSEPFMAGHERAAVLRRVRHVVDVFLLGPENGWSVPDHDSLFIDDSFAADFHKVRGDLEARATTVRVTKLPAHPAVANVLATPTSATIVA